MPEHRMRWGRGGSGHVTAELCGSNFLPHALAGAAGGVERAGRVCLLWRELAVGGVCVCVFTVFAGTVGLPAVVFVYS